MSSGSVAQSEWKAGAVVYVSLCVCVVSLVLAVGFIIVKR